MNEKKRSAIAKYLMNSQSWALKFNLQRYKIIKSCYNVFESSKMEVIYILIIKPILCRQNKFDYSVSLFNYNPLFFRVYIFVFNRL